MDVDEEMPMSNCTRCEICGAAAEINSPGSFVHICQLIRLLLSPFAAFALCLLILALCQSGGFHKNSRLLLVFTALFMIVANIGTFLETTYQMFVNYVMPDDSQCDYQIFKPQHQLVLRDVYLIGACGMAISSATLCIERMLSSAFRKTYDEWRIFLVVGWFLVVAEILLSLLPVLHVHKPPQAFPYSPPEVHNRRDALHLSTALVFANVIAIIMTLALIAIEKNRLKKMHSTTADRLKHLKLILPLIILIAAFITLAHVFFLFLLPDYNETTIINSQVLRDLQTYAPFAEFQLTLTPVVGLLTVLMLLFGSKSVRKAFKNVFRRNPAKAETPDSSRQIYYTTQRPLSDTNSPKIV